MGGAHRWAIVVDCVVISFQTRYFRSSEHSRSTCNMQCAPFAIGSTNSSPRISNYLKQIKQLSKTNSI